MNATRGNEKGAAECGVFSLGRHFAASVPSSARLLGEAALNDWAR